jgi:predicted NBD/HSP70 family sugar kinase
MTDLIGELRSRRIVRELDPIRRPGAGRPTRPIAFDGEPWCVLGLLVDVDAVHVVAATIGGRELWRERVSADLRGMSAAAAGDLVDQVVADQVGRISPEQHLVAVEIGVPGYVTGDRSSVSWSAALDWRDLPLGSQVRNTLAGSGLHSVHVGLSTDTQLAALHAARIELGLPSDAVAAYLGGTRAVGSGLILHGEIFRGANGGGGDFGHINVDPSGPACWCGRNGCLHALVGPEHLLAVGEVVPAAEAKRIVRDEPERAIELIVRAADEGHTALLQVLKRAGAALGDAIDDVLGVVNPETVILGDYLGRLSPHLMSAIEERIAARTNVAAFSHTNVVALPDPVPRALGGACLAARDACFYDPLSLTRPLV